MIRKTNFKNACLGFRIGKLQALFLAALVFAGCNSQIKNTDTQQPGGQTIEEFAVDFSVYGGTGGEIKAKIEGGDKLKKNQKVRKDKTVIFNVEPEKGKEVEWWTLDNVKVNGTNEEYKLKITKDVNVVVKFKDKMPSTKKIEINKISLGYPNLSDKDGKIVEGSALNSNTVIPDFEVPDSKFPVIITHKTEFTVEQVFITFDGGAKEEVNPGAGGNTLIVKEYTLTENRKTSFVIEITADKYEPLKLSFNVTYIRPLLKSLDSVTHITFTTNKGGDKKTVYGAAGDKQITVLESGDEVLNVSTPQPKLTVTLMKSVGQPHAEMKLNSGSLAGDFPADGNKLEIDLPALNKGENPFEITLSKPGYETKTYKLKLNYKPLLSLKKLEVNGTVYNTPLPSPILLEASDTNPVTLAAEVNEPGASLVFRKQTGNKFAEFTPPVSVAQGQTAKLQIFAKLDGYTSTFFNFVLTRKEAVQTIEFTKITIDGTAVAAGASHNIEKPEANVNIEVYLKQAYEGITFTVNDAAKTPEMDTSNMIASFKNFSLNADTANVIKIKADAPGFEPIEQTVTVNHTTPASTGTAYITYAAVTPWDSEDGGHNWPEELTKKGENWEGSVSDDGPHRFTVEINPNGKDLSDIAKFKIYMKNKTHNAIYADTKTGQLISDKVKFEFYRNMTGQEITHATGTNELEVKIYFEEELLESCLFLIKR